ncbi:hypothetical protein OG339_48425 (plasmid) [Streptosporangium sp. NBC_01495]|uniref:hypothetical protein n=1 Tax=Streptosporangium sp. NBC_01495 TaxID=2903899 RepID=UPI002E336B2A|nr:hypothetical protein [Streptosporangium sp. NBC_01495]
MRWKGGQLIAVPDGEVDITEEDVQFPLADLPILVWALNLAAEKTQIGPGENCHDCAVIWHNQGKDCPTHIWATVYRDLAARIQMEMSAIERKGHRLPRYVNGERIEPHPDWHHYSWLNDTLNEIFANREKFAEHYQPDKKV